MPLPLSLVILLLFRSDDYEFVSLKIKASNHTLTRESKRVTNESCGGMDAWIELMIE